MRKSIKKLKAILNPGLLAVILCVEKVFQEEAGSIVTYRCIKAHRHIDVILMAAGKLFQKSLI